MQFETRDPKTGEIVRYNADDDTTSLGEMVRQERFGGGASNQKDMDAQMATAIMGDAKFEVHADRLSPEIGLTIYCWSRTTSTTWTTMRIALVARRLSRMR